MSAQEAWRTWAPPADGQTLREWHDGRCGWCGYRDSSLVRDHCHMTGLIRGLLCRGCNQEEGLSFAPAWDIWRAGENTANAIGHYEIYVNHLGQTQISPQSALNYYSPAEKAAWFTLVVEMLKDGSIKWPAEPPWVEAAVARKEAARREYAEVMGRLLESVPRFGAEAGDPS